MTIVYAPFKDTSPAYIEVNGHRVVVVSEEPEAFLDSLEVFGADRIREISISGTTFNIHEILTTIQPVQDNQPPTSLSVVFADKQTAIPQLLAELQHQLPWIQ